jgi:hypothetical protein
MCKEDGKRDERNGGQLSASDPTQDVVLGDLARLGKYFSALQDNLYMRLAWFSEVLEWFEESSRWWTVIDGPLGHSILEK